MNHRVKTAGVLATALILAGPAHAQPPAAPRQPSQAEIQAMMDPAVEENLRAVTAAIPGVVTISTLRGRMAPAGVQKFNVVAEPGVFYIAAVCDTACSDINLRLLSSAGQVVAADELDNRFPITQATVEAKVAFDVEVILKACSKDPCAWGARILQKPQPK